MYWVNEYGEGEGEPRLVRAATIPSWAGRLLLWWTHTWLGLLRRIHQKKRKNVQQDKRKIQQGG